MLEGVLVNEAIEVLFQLARDFGWATGAYSIPQALGPLLRKALHPFPQGRIRALSQNCLFEAKSENRVLENQ